ncbi:sensor domain-containing diguanylate cyclase [Pararhodospirillum oryzae]|uniref:Diguanylate cyclase n=1 Tax=Pararhodospirillum oryzae TaxID=478448 RepID=A0A512H6A9_9PROT|nr:diguanylate cyclase [Pararhodospirillum oryzae]GEO80983.1 diguanylate cyclase [Pararhodospirillum oryzae]
MSTNAGIGPNDASAIDAARGEGSTIQQATVLAYPGPAALLDEHGKIVACNRRGEVLRLLFSPEAESGLQAVVRAVLHNGAPAVKSAEVRGRGPTRCIDLTLLPTADGSRVAVLGRDTTLELNLRTALADSRQRYKEFVDLSSDFAWETGRDHQFVFVSPVGALGYEARELVGSDPAALLDLREPEGMVRVFRTTARVRGVEVWARRKDGAQACLMVSATPVLGPEGDWAGARGVCQDVTEQREREKALSRARNRERILTYVVRTFRDEMDPANMLNVAAEALVRGLGTEACHIFRAGSDNGTPSTPFVLRGSFGTGGGADLARSVVENADASGLPQEIDGTDWTILVAAARYRRQVNGAVVLWRRKGPWTDDDRLLIMDIASQIGIANEQIGQHERIMTMSRTDSLTGLLNRRAFFEDIERRHRRLERSPQPASLLYVDLDNFKRVNDAHGHLRGDEALLTTKDILVRHTRSVDMIARLGGDEFAVWLEGADEDAACGKAREFLGAAEALRGFNGDEAHPLTMSIGVAVYDPARPEDLEAFTARADAAMYAAKHGGKDHYRVAPPPGQDRT